MELLLKECVVSFNVATPMVIGGSFVYTAHGVMVMVVVV